MSTICVDFDGTISQYDGWQGSDVCGPPILGAVETVREWHNLGHTIIIFTCRADTSVVVDWCCRNGVPYDAINEDPKAIPGSTSGKPLADVYIDDKAIRFDGCWEEVRDKVNNIITIDNEDDCCLPVKDILLVVDDILTGSIEIVSSVSEHTSFLKQPRSPRTPNTPHIKLPRPPSSVRRITPRIKMDPSKKNMSAVEALLADLEEDHDA